MQGLGLGLGLTLAGSSGGGSAPSDDIPDAFTFTDVTGATVSTQYTSNTITVAGIDTASAISITGGTYSINGGGYTASAGSVVNGDQVSVRTTSSGSFSTAVNVVLTIGGVSDTYTVTTTAADDVPSAFTFTDITGATASTQYTSNSITVLGINTSSAISITGGTYSVNGGGYTSSPGTVVLNDTVTVRVTSSGSASTAVNVVLTIGGVSDTYTVTTAAGAIGTPYSLGVISAASGSTVHQMTVANNAAEGDFVIITALTSTIGGLAGGTPVADSKGNTWTQSPSSAARWYTRIASGKALVSGVDTITLTYGSTGGNKTGAAWGVSGISASDPFSGTQASSTTSLASTSINKQAPTDRDQNATIVYMVLNVDAYDNATDTITPDATYSNVATTFTTPGSSGLYVRVDYKILSSTASETYTATINNARDLYLAYLCLNAA